MSLFRRIPILGALCIEVLICQSVSAFLSYLFVSTSKEVMYVDEERARYTGKVSFTKFTAMHANHQASSNLLNSFISKVYASINFGSCVMQFLLLPLVLKRIDNKLLWLAMPLIVSILGIWVAKTTTSENMSLTAVTLSYCIMKILEYSLRGVLAEMVRSSEMANAIPSIPICSRKLTIQSLHC
jgi:hypothetical protein